MNDYCEFNEETRARYSVLQDSTKAHEKCNLHAAKVACALIEKTVPTYFVSRGLMTALMNTDLPRDFSVEEMPWPLDSMLFCLPEGTIVTEKGDFSVIAVCKCTERIYPSEWMDWGEMDHRIVKKEVSHNGPDSACILAISDRGRVIQWECPITPASIFDSANIRVLDSDLAEFSFSECQGNEIQDIPKAVFQILLAMLACPEMIEAGVLLREEKQKKGKLQNALWRPNFFGKSYRKYDAITGDPGDHPHRKRIHWRRGHFRHQRYGKGLNSIRVIWIEPVLIGAEKV